MLSSNSLITNLPLFLGLISLVLACWEEIFRFCALVPLGFVNFPRYPRTLVLPLQDVRCEICSFLVEELDVSEAVSLLSSQYSPSPSEPSVLSDSPEDSSSLSTLSGAEFIAGTLSLEGVTSSVRLLFCMDCTRSSDSVGLMYDRAGCALTTGSCLAFSSRATGCVLLSSSASVIAEYAERNPMVGLSLGFPRQFEGMIIPQNASGRSTPADSGFFAELPCL